MSFLSAALPEPKSPVRLLERPFDTTRALSLTRSGLDSLTARLLSARNAKAVPGLGALLHHTELKGAHEAACLLLDAIDAGRPMVVVADYDCDGATACAVAVRGLRAFGADITYVVPDRMVHGYGLTPGVVLLARECAPDARVLITVDNGIASHAGVDAANASGFEVLVTDHHLPAAGKPLPDASVIVDPSQPGCGFASKSLAGVGVIWYVLWALQDLLRSQGRVVLPEQKVSNLLPLVAVGTVADVVGLDENNRILVAAGLERIRRGKGFVGIDELARAGFGNTTRIEALSTADIGFGIGPRINAAGRLQTMALGIDCLLSDDRERARLMARELNTINQTRKTIEQEAVDLALTQALAQVRDGAYSITAHAEHWHPGVIGIVAGRIKEKRWRPTFVMCTDEKTGQIKGSGRSIPGFNLKDALDLLDKREPGLMLKFGGHAMAAGLTLTPGSVERFSGAFEQVVRDTIDPAVYGQDLMHDGSLDVLLLNTRTALELARQPWGQQFPAPLFRDTFTVLGAVLKGAAKDQLVLSLQREGLCYEAVKFRHEGPVPQSGESLDMVYSLNAVHDKYGKAHLKLLTERIVTPTCGATASKA